MAFSSSEIFFQTTRPRIHYLHNNNQNACEKLPRRRRPRPRHRSYGQSPGEALANAGLLLPRKRYRGTGDGLRRFGGLHVQPWHHQVPMCIAFGPACLRGFVMFCSNEVNCYCKGKIAISVYAQNPFSLV